MTTFKVTRTSTWDDKPPFPGAKSMMVPCWDRRTFKSPEEHDARLPESIKWADRGTEHGLVYGPRGGVTGIKRRLGDKKIWTVEINDLSGLMAFVEKYGEVVLSDYDHLPEIEIYDGYRE